jgi:hypothetical protein
MQYFLIPLWVLLTQPPFRIWLQRRPRYFRVTHPDVFTVPTGTVSFSLHPPAELDVLCPLGELGAKAAHSKGGLTPDNQVITSS